LAFTLRKDGIRYSPAERKLFGLLSTQQVTSKALAHRLHGTRALNGRATVISAAKSLIRKSQRNREPFRICKTKRAGPHPVAYWLERRA
jgi:hypothetical protein